MLTPNEIHNILKLKRNSHSHPARPGISGTEILMRTPKHIGCQNHMRAVRPIHSILPQLLISFKN